MALWHSYLGSTNFILHPPCLPRLLTLLLLPLAAHILDMPLHLLISRGRNLRSCSRIPQSLPTYPRHRRRRLYGLRAR